MDTLPPALKHDPMRRRWRGAGAWAVLFTLALGGCPTPAPVGSMTGAPVSQPPRLPSVEADGPPDRPAPDPMTVPDPQPQVEPIRAGGPNKPYEVGGQNYVPATVDVPMVERGLASWYGKAFHGKRTASGETYNMNAMTAAHRTMPIPSFARVRNPANGREVIVRVNDRGPFVARRIIDLSYAAAVKLGLQNGVATVEVSRITHDEIRAGLAGQRGGETRQQVDAAARPTPDAASSPPDTMSAQSAATEPLTQTATMPASAATTVSAAPEKGRAWTSAAAGFWLQLGAFAKGEGAFIFQQRVAQELEWLSPLLTVIADGGLHRLQAGPYATRDQAREAAERVRAALQLVPVLVERR